MVCQCLSVEFWWNVSKDAGGRTVGLLLVFKLRRSLPLTPQALLCIFEKLLELLIRKVLFRHFGCVKVEVLEFVGSKYLYLKKKVECGAAWLRELGPSMHVIPNLIP